MADRSLSRRSILKAGGAIAAAGMELVHPRFVLERQDHAFALGHLELAHVGDGKLGHRADSFAWVKRREMPRATLY